MSNRQFPPCVFAMLIVLCFPRLWNGFSTLLQLTDKNFFWRTIEREENLGISISSSIIIPCKCNQCISGSFDADGNTNDIQPKCTSAVFLFQKININEESIKNSLKIIFQHVNVLQMVHLALTTVFVLMQLVAHVQRILEYALVQMGILVINAINVTMGFMMKMVMEQTTQQYVQVFYENQYRFLIRKIFLYLLFFSLWMFHPRIFRCQWY